MIDQARQRDRLDFKRFRQIDLAHTFMASDVNERTRLRQSQRTTLHALLKGAPQQARHITQQETETVLTHFLVLART